VPKCGKICGIFTTDIKKFIIYTVNCRLKRFVKWDVQEISEGVYLPEDERIGIIHTRKEIMKPIVIRRNENPEIK
jgi:hypothetical protein